MAKMDGDNVDDLLKKLKHVNTELQKNLLFERETRDYVTARATQEEQIANIKQFNNELEQKGIELSSAQKKELESIYGHEESIGKKVKDSNRAYEKRLSLTRTITQQLSHGWKYLIESDKVIRQTSLSLGLSSTKADLMRQSFQQSARDVAHLGGTLADIQAITTGYADETGRARVLTAQMITDIEEIAKGTGLSVSEATELGARFEYMGLDARRTNEYIQGVVDTTERMGINTTKVLKNINSNYKRLTTFSFKNGTKAFKEMAMSAESTRVSMDTAMNVAEATRNLESVIELGANLQVMGGEFAKMDPLAWLHMARNEPEKIQEQIGKMTTGLFTLRKNSEGIFEKFISPADRDRLANVAKSLGISNEEMFEIAQRQTDMALMSRQLAGTGLSEKEKALIKGAAQFNSDSGKFQVKLGGHMRDISNLTKDQARAFESEQTLLKDRAVATQDFDTALKATIEEFKSVLLPILQGVNRSLAWVRKTVLGLGDSLGVFSGKGKDSGFLTGIGRFGFYVVLLNKTLGIFNKSIGGFVGSIGRMIGIGKSSTKVVGGVAGGGGMFAGMGGTDALKHGKASMYAGKGAGMKGLGMGAGIGAAGLGIGGGIGLAAGGISLLAKAMSGLNKDQADALASIVSSMAWMTAAGGAFATALVWIGKSAGISAAGLAKATLPILGIGAAIGIATAGIGVMGMGMSKMMDSAMDAKGSLFELALGVSALSLSMLGLGSGIGFAGMLALGGILKTVSKHSEGVEKVGEAFKNINTFLSGSKDDFSAIETTVKTISGVGEKNSNPIKELIELLKTPLQVRFDEKEVIIRNNISLSVDGKEFTSDVIHVPTLMEMIHRHQTSKF